MATGLDGTHRHVWTTGAAPLDTSRTGCRAPEPAIVRMGLPSIVPGPHALRLHGSTAPGPRCASEPVMQERERRETLSAATRHATKRCRVMEKKLTCDPLVERKQ